MTDSGRPVSNVATANTLTSSDRVLTMMANGAVRTSNVCTFLANSATSVTVGKLLLGNTRTPAAHTSNCNAGEIWSDGTYLYVGAAANSIIRFGSANNTF